MGPPQRQPTREGLGGEIPTEEPRGGRPSGGHRGSRKAHVKRESLSHLLSAATNRWASSGHLPENLTVAEELGQRLGRKA